MPEWVVSCPHCHKSFCYTAIDPRPAQTPYDPLWPTKPEFPQEGLNLTCPNCGHISKYQRFDLMYSPR